MKVIFFIVAFVFIAGCATKISQSNLYWGDYSNTLYLVKKEPGEASDMAHEKELQSIVEKSEDLNLRVPPGVYAELGLYALERGDTDSANSYFGLEQKTYPEGSILMQKTLKNKLSES